MWSWLLYEYGVWRVCPNSLYFDCSISNALEMVSNAFKMTENTEEDFWQTLGTYVFPIPCTLYTQSFKQNGLLVWVQFTFLLFPASSLGILVSGVFFVQKIPNLLSGLLMYLSTYGLKGFAKFSSQGVVWFQMVSNVFEMISNSFEFKLVSEDNFLHFSP